MLAQILGATGEAKGDEQKVTTLSLQRQQRLADRVTSIKFMMVSDVPAFFQALPPASSLECYL